MSGAAGSIGRAVAEHLGRLARAEDVVRVTALLASDEASYMTGQAINITGGREMH